MQDYKKIGLKAAKTNKARHGEDFYARIGAMGGKKSKNGGFASKKECHCKLIEGTHYHQQCAGKKGGSISRRVKQ